VGVLGERRLNKINLQFGAGVQAMVVRQIFQVTQPGERNRLDGTEQKFTQFTAGPYVQGGIHVPVGPVVGLDFGARAVFYPVDVDFQRSFFVMGQVYAGGGFRFGGKKLGMARKAKPTCAGPAPMRSSGRCVGRVLASNPPCSARPPHDRWRGLRGSS
jgi:hypothetical protein